MLYVFVQILCNCKFQSNVFISLWSRRKASSLFFSFYLFSILSIFFPLSSLFYSLHFLSSFLSSLSSLHFPLFSFLLIHLHCFLATNARIFFSFYLFSFLLFLRYDFLFRLIQNNKRCNNPGDPAQQGEDQYN